MIVEDPQALADALATGEQRVHSHVGEFRPQFLLTLGSGLGDACKSATVLAELPFTELLPLPSTNVKGHAGKLLLVEWAGKQGLVSQGRLHRYEGRPWWQVTYLVRLAHRLGANVCLLTNMSGAVSTRLRPGALVAIDDHLNLMGDNPLAGYPPVDPARTFPDMGDAYARRLRDLADEVARKRGVELSHGVYAALLGPNYETPAEIRALRLLGADLVGMSTVGEVLVARQLGMELLAISCVANAAAGVTPGVISHTDVLDQANAAVGRLALILAGVVQAI